MAYEENALLPLKDYQRKRILTFVAPEVVDPHGIGPNWNRVQALIAVATGGISGKGLGEGLKVAANSADLFGRLLAVSVSVLLMAHVFVNIGMTLGITPITGLPLPFLSHGGSFVVTSFLLMGVVQSVYRYRKEFLA